MVQRLRWLRAFREAWRLARQLDPDRPWASPGAESLDELSFGSWLAGLGLRGDAYRHTSALVEALTSTPIEKLSLLHVLWWLRRADGPFAALRTTFQMEVREGAQAIPTRLAEELGESVVLETPVVGIRQDASVEVETDSGRRYVAQRAIVSIPVTLTGRVRFEPPLPEALQGLSRLRIDPLTKLFALLPPGLRVRHRAVIGGRPLSAAYRSSDRVVGFAPPAYEDRSDSELLDDLASAFGVSKGRLRSPIVFRWKRQPHVPGCDIGFRPGELCRHGPSLRRPHGLVHFAGSERSSWPNNMEGAVESGVRAAEEAIASVRAGD
jgi:monoamine oxidase